MKVRKIILSFLLTINVSLAAADWRAFVWTYGYQTMQKGKYEIEYYLNKMIPDVNLPGVNTWQHWLEFEYGITDRWDISIYQMGRRDNTLSGTSGFNYEGYKLRTRYRFLEKGKWLVDPLLYLEYIKLYNYSDTDALEAKVVLEKTLGKITISYNQIFEKEPINDGAIENEYAFGANYAIAPTFKLGLESTGNITAGTSYWGPTISIARKRKVFVSLGVLTGMNDKSDDFRMRMIAGVAFGRK